MNLCKETDGVVVIRRPSSVFAVRLGVLPVYNAPRLGNARLNSLIFIFAHLFVTGNMFKCQAIGWLALEPASMN